MWLRPQPIGESPLGAGPDERQRIAYENSQGRRLNVLAVLISAGPYVARFWVTFPGTFRADHIARLCEELPPVPVPTVVVLENASIHVRTIVRAARSADLRGTDGRAHEPDRGYARGRRRVP